MLLSDYDGIQYGSSYIVRDYVDDDIAGIVRLHFEIEPDENATSQEYELAWRWLHQRNPYSTSKVLVGVDRQNQIVAHTGMFPLKFIAFGNSLLAGFPEQLMVAEGFRQSLLFANLETRFLKEYKESGVKFVYALVTRSRILKAHLALGYKGSGSLPVYARPYGLARLVEHYVANPVLRFLSRPALSILEFLLRFNWNRKPEKLDVIQASRFTEEWEPFLQEACRGFQYYALRNANILNWRFPDFPGRTYQIHLAFENSKPAGYVVLRRMKMMGFDVLGIVDILFQPGRNDIGQALLSAIHQVAVESKVDMCACLLSPYSPFLPILKRFGYIKTPQSFTLIVHKPKDETITVDEKAFEHWHLTWFDNDYA
jgi:hypothetical protein